jgi:chemotaxis protein methyltransferase CheR
MNESILRVTHRLTSTEFNMLSRMVYAACGINLEPVKKTMVESRLNRRLRALNLQSFGDYIEMITGKDASQDEFINMIDAVTTNKTDFFREPHHFEFLTNHIVPSFLSAEESRPMRVWSAASSSGEEPYTLAMILEEVRHAHPGFFYEILASDISTSVLKKAVEAIYPADRADDIPLHYRKKYILKSKDATNPRIRVVAPLREAVMFAQINLIGNDLPVERMQDIIFCRNVLIYFDRDTQFRVISNLLTKLKPGGFLFIGHSESLHFFDLPVKQVRPTIFIKN